MTDAQTTTDSLDDAARSLEAAARYRRQAHAWWIVVGGLLGVAVVIDLVRARQQKDVA